MTNTLRRILLRQVVPMSCIIVAHSVLAQPNVAPLEGLVRSEAEGPMEGVLVSARKVGTNITVTSVTDDKGRYRFPAGSLSPGRYALTIRAVGYDLPRPSSVTVKKTPSANGDLELVPTADLSAQLSDAEWLMSMPGSPDQKADLTECNSCHSLQRIVRSAYTAEQFQNLIIPRMSGYYTNNSSPQHAQVRPNTKPPKPTAKQLGMTAAMASYLASINLSGGRKTWTYPLVAMPRPKGPETRVIVTEYDLPRPDIAPHDVVVTKKGQVFYSSFFEQALGELDPRTGLVREYKTPLLKPGAPTGALDLEYDENSGQLWMALMLQGGVLRFDPETKAMRVWQVPAEFQNDSTQQAFLTVPSPIDGKMWIKDSARRSVYLFDPASGSFELKGPIVAPDGHSLNLYGIYSDSKNNLYGLDHPSFVYGADRTNYIGKIDHVSGEISTYMTPTHTSRPRRGRFDAQDRLWFAEYSGNAIGMFDAKTNTIREWPLPGLFNYPYDAARAKDGRVWTGSMFTDRVTRLNPDDGSTVSYLLPRSTNIRRVFVDDRTTPPTLWVGSNLGGSIVKVQPVE